MMLVRGWAGYRWRRARGPVGHPARRQGWQLSGIRAAALAISVAALGGLASASPAAAAEHLVIRHFYAPETPFVVPVGVSSINVVAVGGHGGGNLNGIPGGKAARVAGELSVIGGETLYLHVGGSGATATLKNRGGAGGGASDVRTEPVSAGLSPDPRVIVAGGGGGAGGAGFPSHGKPSGNPGEGGNAEEEGGETETALPGGGATPTAPGAPGSGSCAEGTQPTGGSLEVGGEGGSCPNSGLSGGAGGAGLYGGGGGGASQVLREEGAAGGGGGSSLVPLGGTASLAAAAERPQVTMSYMAPPSAPIAVTAAATAVTKTAATLNATVNPEGEEVTACTFEYGPTAAYGSSVPCSVGPGAGDEAVAVSAPVSGLTANSGYHYRIVATNPTGTSDGTDEMFATLAYNRPAVTSLNPNTGSALGGTTVTISGNELSGASAVHFGGRKAATFTVESNEQITATSPEGDGGVNVTVTTPGGTSATPPQTVFTYSPRPLINAVSPRHGGEAGGTEVRIFGNNLYGVTSVTFGSTPASFSHQGFDIVAITPGGTGTVGITLTNATGESNKSSEIAEFGYESGAPEFGRCVLQGMVNSEGLFEPYQAEYNSNTCKSKVRIKATYEWMPGVIKTGFHPRGGTAILESTSHLKVSCTGSSGSGQITGGKTLGGVTLRLTGCISAKQKCTTAGLVPGEIATSTLDATLGWENRSTYKVALDLYPATAGPFMTYTCGTGPATTLHGSVLVPVKAGTMILTLSAKAFEGKQKPEALEKSEQDVLRNEAEEQVGLTATNIGFGAEEPIEVNPWW